MTVHQVSSGDGVPVLALHGWTPDHRLMTGCLEPIFAELPGYRRIYPDLPGMGQSPAGDIDSSDGILAAVNAFIDEQIGDEPFAVLDVAGHNLQLEQPELFGTLVREWLQRVC